jgi:hypothetical protein
MVLWGEQERAIFEHDIAVDVIQGLRIGRIDGMDLERKTEDLTVELSWIVQKLSHSRMRTLQTRPEDAANCL